jgi:hypothetical protein
VYCTIHTTYIGSNSGVDIIIDLSCISDSITNYGFKLLNIVSRLAFLLRRQRHSRTASAAGPRSALAIVSLVRLRSLQIHTFNSQIDSLEAAIAQLTRKRDEMVEHVQQDRAILSRTAGVGLRNPGVVAASNDETTGNRALWYLGLDSNLARSLFFFAGCW